MLAIVVLMLVYLTPAIVSLGRELDFVPRDPAPPGMSRFWVLHAAYTSLEMLKLLVGAVVAFWIVRSASRSSRDRQKNAAALSWRSRQGAGSCRALTGAATCFGSVRL